VNVAVQLGGCSRGGGETEERSEGSRGRRSSDEEEEEGRDDGEEGLNRVDEYHRSELVM